ncbi:MAG: HAMP domain-containing histidine kinase [Lachnospiraceae bacterium]|nr:HAMP domain-containing histidine kinase [Lachnospiraceae bacterium]
MKRSTIYRRFLLPALFFLLLIPPIACLVFRQNAKSYVYRKTMEDLEALQVNIDLIMEQDFSDNGETRGKNSIISFMRKAGSIASEIGGNARLMILTDEMRLSYPRDRELRDKVKPLVGEFSRIIEKGFEGSTTLTVESGETFLVDISRAPAPYPQMKYIIIYCPSSRVGGWITRATILVLVISAGIAVAVFVALWLAARSVTAPLNRLCDEAERIGKGNFELISPEFSLKELEELRNAMNRMSDQLRRSDESQKAFFQNVSHRIRNPLMSINGYAQGIEKGIFPDDKAAAHTILEESDRLAYFVGSLLTLSRLDSGETHIELGDIQVLDVIEDCYDRFRGLAFQNNVTLNLELAGYEITAMGEEELLTRVLDNLISNAIRYAKTEVVISVKEQGDQVLISVMDDGDGIDKEDLPHIFERYYKGKGGNFGIGLAIASSAAEKMNGNLTGKNRPEGGAVFTCALSKG